MGSIRRQHVHDLFLFLAVLSASYATAASLAGGAALFLLGLAMHVWSKGALRRNTQVCTDGPYALCRHPFYLGNALLDLGLCVMSGNLWLAALYPLGFWAGYRKTLRSEEARLTAIFGDGYRSFRRSTPAVLPAVWRLGRAGSGGFSWRNVLAERVPSRILRHLSFPLLVVLAHRIWVAPGDFLNHVNLAMAIGAAALPLLAIIVYQTVEGRSGKPHVLHTATLALGRHGLIACVLLLPLAALPWESDGENLIMALAFSALLLGWSTGMNDMCRVLRGKWRATAVVARRAGEAGVVVFGLWQVQALWLAPLALALCAGRALLPRPATAAPARPRLRLAGSAAACLIGLLTVTEAGGVVLSDHYLHAIKTAMNLKAEPDSVVIMVKDWRLDGLSGSPYIDAEVTPAQLAGLRERLASARRVVIVAEDDVVVHVRSAVDRPLQVEHVVRAGSENFYVLVGTPALPRVSMAQSARRML